MMFAEPFSGIMPPSGSYNPGYGAPGGGSMSRWVHSELCHDLSFPGVVPLLTNYE